MSMKSPDPTDKHVGGRVRMQRMMIGMSQEKLGDALGITFQQVQKYEKGVNRIGASRLQQISKALGVTVAFFFEGMPEADVVSADVTSPPYVSEFLATSDGLALMRAFTRIRDTGIRGRIVDLVEALSNQAVATRPMAAE